MTEQLKPCPFCDGAAHFFKITDLDDKNFGGEGICCGSCPITTDLMFPLMEDCKPKLAEAWNRRAQPAQAVPVLTDAEIHAADPIPQNRFDQERAEFARRVEQAVRAKMGAAQWIACEDKMPEPGTECLVHVKALSTKQNGPTHYTHIDTWDEQREAPVSWSSATIPVGLGWGSFDFEDVTHWMPLPPPPGIVGKEGE